jgi:hypothetical protein
MPQNWIVELVEDPETKDLLLPFPEDVLKLMDWEEGTVLCWEITTDNKIVLKKKIDDEDRDEDNGL